MAKIKAQKFPVTLGLDSTVTNAIVTSGTHFVSMMAEVLHSDIELARLSN